MKDKPVWERIGLHSQTGYFPKGIIPMNEKKWVDFEQLGHYVEGDYMVEENNSVIFSCEADSKMRLSVTNHQSIVLCIPHDDMSSYEFVFKNKEDWENFCEATWKTENYIPMKRTDFIEFFKALQFVYNHHQNQLTQAKLKHDTVKGWIDEQENNLNKLQDMIIGYEEVYNESKV